MQQGAIRIGVFVLCLTPFGVLAYQALTAALGPDPAEAIMHVTGEWSLRLLALTLLITPLRRHVSWPVLFKLRRMLGLFAFFYACVHLVSFGHFFVGWTPAILLEELVERPYITAGFAGWLLMLPLAVTSTRKMQRRLRRNWLRLHRLVYPAAIAACLHLLWQTRSDIGEALVYIAVFSLLLGWRLWHYRQGRSASGSGPAGGASASA
jgi:sulfoxide reductase heme-binding subunit YedZ